MANRNLSLELLIRILCCYIFPVLLYECESWTIDAATEKKIEAFEMYANRRMLRISWTEHKSNIEVIQQMGKHKELLTTIKERKLQYLEHIMKGERYILRLIIDGKIEGKRSVGRRQNSWLRDLRRWFGQTSIDIFRAVVSRATIAIWIANLRRETVLRRRRREIDLQLTNTRHEKISVYYLVELLNTAFLKVATMEKVIAGYRTAGIYPLNPKKVTEDDLAHANQI